MNRYYTYPDIDMMSMDYWKDRNSMVWPLGVWISEHNGKYARENANLSLYNHRTDGIFNSKTHSNTYQDVVDNWQKQGLYLRTGEMAGVCWAAMVPEDVYLKQNKNAEILVVLHEGDYSNPNYLMNAIAYYQKYNDMALRDNRIVLYVMPDGVDKNAMFIPVLQELCAILHVEPASIFLDVSPVYRLGKQLVDIPDFHYVDRYGKEVNPDLAVCEVDDIKMLDITDHWANTNSSLVRFINGGAFNHPLFNLDDYIHSPAGRRVAEAVVLERDFKTPDDSALLAKWEEMGLIYQAHQTEGEQWLSFVPKSAFDEQAEKVPVVAIFQEVNAINPFLSISAFASFYDWFDIAANGDVALLFFALESADDNDLYADIIREACAYYPLDAQRVYLTGHSHNAQFACEFARRHPEMLAAIAPTGMSHTMPAPDYSYEVLKVTDEMIEQSAKLDLPIVNINGYCENEVGWLEQDSERYRLFVQALQRRFKAFRCPIPSVEEIAAARMSQDKITQLMGIPADRTSVQTRLGQECYILDIKNNEGKEHMRLISIERMIHAPAPQMAGLVWDFLRRFERDLETKEIIERY